MILRVRRILRRLETAGFVELLVESGLERDSLAAALAYWESRGNIRKSSPASRSTVVAASGSEYADAPRGCRGCPLGSSCSSSHGRGGSNGTDAGGTGAASTCEGADGTLYTWTEPERIYGT